MVGQNDPSIPDARRLGIDNSFVTLHRRSSWPRPLPRRTSSQPALLVAGGRSDAVGAHKSDCSRRNSCAFELSTHSPVAVKCKIEGFVFNRLQGALLREAYFLVGEGVVTPRDVDTLVREGLGRRWSVTGPFATSKLSTRGGTAQHAEVIGAVYARIGSARGADDPWVPQTISCVMDEWNELLPADNWEANVLRRELAMVTLEGLRQRGNVPSVILENEPRA